MQLAFYALPARGDAGLQEDLGRFFRSHRVLTVHREFVAQGENSFWALSVEYLESGRGARTPRLIEGPENAARRARPASSPAEIKMIEGVGEDKSGKSGEGSPKPTWHDPQTQPPKESQ